MPGSRVALGRIVGGQARHVGEALRGQPGGDRGGVGRVGEHGARLGVAQNAEDPGEVLALLGGQRCGDGHGTGVQAGGERLDEVQARRVEQEDLAVRGSVLLEP